jgi:HEAT repeat protein
VRKLLKATKDRDAEVRRSAVLALGALQARQAVGRMSEMLVSDPDGYVRSASARSLEKVGDMQAVPHLVWSLQNDDDYFVRKCAASALGVCPCQEAASALEKACQGKGRGRDCDPAVREAASRSLKRMQA